MKPYSSTRFAILAFFCTSSLIIASAFWIPMSFFANTVPGGTKETAKEALSLMKDWTVWMASIQTATIAALGLLAKDGLPTLILNAMQVRLAVLVALFNTLALLFSAWLLTSLSSLMLRVYRDGLSNYDFYNFPLYAYMDHVPAMKAFTVGFFAFWNHWLWGAGILVFGALSLSIIARRTSSQVIDQRE